jgi:hypothetical protein
MIPIPPNQAVNALQKRMLWGSTSTSLKIDAPVVVKPLVVSKTASQYVVHTPENQKGSAPRKIHTIQLNVTIAILSRMPISASFFLKMPYLIHLVPVIIMGK